MTPPQPPVTDRIALGILGYFLFVVLPAAVLFVILERWFDRGGFWHFR